MTTSSTASTKFSGRTHVSKLFEIDEKAERHICLDDDAARFLVPNSRPIDPVTDRHLLRKADIHILPILFLVYAAQYMDKISNGVGAIMSLRTDLNMTGQMYPWVGSSYYLGLLVFELPVSYLLQKLPMAKTTAIMIFIWGIIMMASAGCTSYAPYIVTRVLLGALEGAITPAFVILTSQWYKRKEQFSRTCYWYAAVHFGALITNAIAIGILNSKQNPYQQIHLSGWKEINLILGAITIFLSLIFWWRVPNNPGEANWLTEDEKRQLVERIRENQQGFGTSRVKLSHIKEAMLDLRTYLYFFTTVAFAIPNGAVTNFQSILIKNMGFGTTRSLVMNFPSNCTGLGGIILVGFLSNYILKNHRIVWGIIGFAGNVMDCSLLAWGPNNHTKLAGISLFSMFSPLGYIGLLTSVESNVAGHTKKVFSAAVILVAYCVGNIVGPQMFVAREAPDYPSAREAMAGCAAAALVLLTILELYNAWENKKRDESGIKLHIVNGEFADLTDKQNPEFRYAL